MGKPKSHPAIALSATPAKKPRKHRTRRPPVSLSDDELLALLTKAYEHRRRNWIMILVAYYHGLRAEETVKLRAMDFHFGPEGGELRIRALKGSQDSDQTLTKHDNPMMNELAAVRDWLQDRPKYGKKGGAKPPEDGSDVKMRQSTQKVAFLPSSPLFPVGRKHFWTIVHRYALEVGIPLRKCKTHVLKHTCAKQLLAAGVPLNVVQARLRWKSLSSAEFYTRVNDDEASEIASRVFRNKDAFRAIQQHKLF